MKFQLLTTTKMLINKDIFPLYTPKLCIYPVINVKMPTITDVLTLMNNINFILSIVEHEICLYHRVKFIPYTNEPLVGAFIYIKKM